MTGVLPGLWSHKPLLSLRYQWKSQFTLITKATKCPTLGLTYISRKNSEQFYFTALKDADPNSFEPISMLYAKDKNRYYYAEDAKKNIAEKGLMPLLSYTIAHQDEESPI